MKVQQSFVDACYEQALKSYHEGGLPIGAVLVRAGKVLARGHNERVQSGSPILHGEMACLQCAGRQNTYRDTALYTSLSPCMMCAGTIVQFGIPSVVICDSQNYGGNEEFLRSRGVDVEIVHDERCVALMRKFIEEQPQLWNEDIAAV
jgi:cytosine/creatinine deaminase